MYCVPSPKAEKPGSTHRCSLDHSSLADILEMGELVCWVLGRKARRPCGLLSDSLGSQPGVILPLLSFR